MAEAAGGGGRYAAEPGALARGEGGGRWNLCLLFLGGSGALVFVFSFFFFLAFFGVGLKGKQKGHQPLVGELPCYKQSMELLVGLLYKL